MANHLSLGFGFLLFVAGAFGAQDVASAVQGTVKRIDAGQGRPLLQDGVLKERGIGRAATPKLRPKLPFHRYGSRRAIRIF